VINAGQPARDVEGHLALCGLRGPSNEVIRRFHNFNRHLVIILEPLAGRGLEGFHAAVSIEMCCSLFRFEVEPSLMNNAEICVVSIESVASEHRAAGETAEIGQLIQDEVFEAVVSLSHGGSQGFPHPGDFCGSFENFRDEHQVEATVYGAKGIHVEWQVRHVAGLKHHVRESEIRHFTLCGSQHLVSEIHSDHTAELADCLRAKQSRVTCSGTKVEDRHARSQPYIGHEPMIKIGDLFVEEPIPFLPPFFDMVPALSLCIDDDLWRWLSHVVPRMGR
jgi:hypothetical protein